MIEHIEKRVQDEAVQRLGKAFARIIVEEVLISGDASCGSAAMDQALIHMKAFMKTIGVSDMDLFAAAELVRETMLEEMQILKLSVQPGGGNH